MSFKILNAAWNTDCESGMEKLVLAAMADYCDDKGFCWPSTTTLAKRCSITRKSVMEQIAKLEAAGFLSVERRGWRGNRYTLHCHPRLQPPVTNGDNPLSPTVTKAVTHGDTIRQEPSVQPSRGRKPPLFRGAERVSADKEVDRIIQLQRAFKANHPIPWNSAEKAEWAEMVDRKTYLKAGLGAKY